MDEEIIKYCKFDASQLYFQKPSKVRLTFDEGIQIYDFGDDFYESQFSIELKAVDEDYDVICYADSQNLKLQNLQKTVLEWIITPKKIKFNIIVSYHLNCKNVESIPREQPFTEFYPCKVSDSIKARLKMCKKLFDHRVLSHVLAGVVGFIVTFFLTWWLTC